MIAILVYLMSKKSYGCIFWWEIILSSCLRDAHAHLNKVMMDSLYVIPNTSRAFVFDHLVRELSYLCDKSCAFCLFLFSSTCRNLFVPSFHGLNL